MLLLMDCLDLKSCLLGILLLLLLVDFLKHRNPPNFPPGPWPLPFVGNLFTGFGYQAVDKGDHFLDRPASPLCSEVFRDFGISTSNGYRWRRQRQFSVGHLKQFSEGKKTLELHVQLECNFLCQAFKQEMGVPFNPQVIINSAAANSIVSLVFGKRFDYGTTDFQDLLQLRQESMLLTGHPLVQCYNIFPWLFKRLPGLRSGPHSKILSNNAKIVSFLKKEIEKHKKDWDPFDHRDFSDSYIGEIDKKKRDTEAGFHSENLAYCCFDLFEAGIETVTNTLLWALLYILNHPEVQEKVQEEIDSVIGPSRQPCSADRVNMPYTDAVIHETQRMANILPLNARKTNKDTTVGGYFIPQGTKVIVNLSSVLRDPSEWETAGYFNPEHFLDEHGHFRKRKAFFPFSAGKRACLGEPLARMELFLFFTSLLQRFTISLSPGKEPPSLEPQGTAILSPEPFTISASTR
ncbi:cytochrome P450 2J2 isoform X2 [Esox lucius]|uniref:cytochrome P450 2J2 isoform X2 n=1 Tax=Esox lucius TaxID=8010 RepID=UPI000661B7BF|nr:cytochrome P450 2J2 isoform X2 [Esox lucius]